MITKFKIFELNSDRHIQKPDIGSIVKHTGWRYEDDDNYPCDVYILSGDYLIDDRVSNFWKWRRVLPDGTLSNEIDSNYGNFEESEIIEYHTYTKEEIKEIYPEKYKEIYPEKYEEYILKKDAERYNL